jgi:DNA-binding transcriptional ArsR family regulator
MDAFPDRAVAPGALEGPADELQAKFIRGLGDPTRLRIVRHLLHGPRSVSDLIELLGMPQSRVSNHLACLKWCGYVATERRGRSVIYHIADERVRAVLELTRCIVSDNARRIADCVRIADR